MRAALLVLVAASFLGSSTAEAQFGPQPPNQLYYRLTTVARANPLGLISFGQVTYRRRLFQTNSIFTRDNYFGVGITPTITPAFTRIGPMVEFQPVPFFRLWASYEFVGYYGTFDFLQSYPNAAVDYSDSAIDDRSSEAYATTGSQLTLSGTLQAKLGPVALRSVLRAFRPDYNLNDGDRVFYDVFLDILMEDRGWTLNNDFDLLYLHADRFTVGVRYTWARSLLSSDSFQGIDCAIDGNDCGDIITHRVGPLFAYTHFKEYKARYNGPTFLVAVNWWLKHPSRTGQDVSQAFPYILLGFSFSGDLLAPPPGEDSDDEFPPLPPPPPPPPPADEPADEPSETTETTETPEMDTDDGEAPDELEPADTDVTGEGESTEAGEDAAADGPTDGATDGATDATDGATEEPAGPTGALFPRRGLF
ncbi:MAG: hypothetical protein AAGE52_09200 [Myxococcota bacterium]